MNFEILYLCFSKLNESFIFVFKEQMKSFALSFVSNDYKYKWPPLVCTPIVVAHFVFDLEVVAQREDLLSDLIATNGRRLLLVRIRIIHGISHAVRKSKQLKVWMQNRINTVVCTSPSAWQGFRWMTRLRMTSATRSIWDEGGLVANCVIKYDSWLREAQNTIKTWHGWCASPWFRSFLIRKHECGAWRDCQCVRKKKKNCLRYQTPSRWVLQHCEPVQKAVRVMYRPQRSCQGENPY